MEKRIEKVKPHRDIPTLRRLMKWPNGLRLRERPKKMDRERVLELEALQENSGGQTWSPTGKPVLARRSGLQHAGVVSCVGG